MGRYTQNVIEKIDFDGDEITVTLRRMQNKHMLILSPLLQENPGEHVFARSSRIIAGAGDVLKECIVSLEGLRGADNNNIGIDIVLNDAYFMSLVDKILGRLLGASVVTESDAKKSAEVAPVVSSDATPETIITQV